MTKEFYQQTKLKGENNMVIKFSRSSDKYGCFSNFTHCKVNFGGITYNSTEAAWQAQKTLNENERKQFATLNPSEAKKLGRKVNLRPDWEEVKYQLMVDVCYEKFKNSKKFREVLLSTENDEIIENTTGWHDNIWGNCECPKCINKPGRNLLGKALMEVRERLRNEIE